MKKIKLKKKLIKLLKVIGSIVLVLLFLVISLLLFVRSEWGQKIIVQKLTNYVSDKTHTTVNVDRVFITFSGNVFVEGLYLEDTQKDTLIYSKELEANIALMPLIKGSGFTLNRLDWKGVKANIKQQDTLNGFNYQFLIDAFASDTTNQATTSSQSSFDINIGKVNLEDFQLQFDDQATGMYAQGEIGNILVEMDSFDLDNMKFIIDQLSISNSNIVYQQNKELPTTEPESDSPLPYLGLHNITLKNVSANYKSVPDHIELAATISESTINIPELDLTNQKIKAENILLANSQVTVHTSDINADATTNTTTSSDFTWPAWDVTLQTLTLQNNYISYTNNNAKPQYGKLNPDAIELSNATIKVKNVYLQNESAGIEVTEGAITEASGIHLKHLEFKTEITNKGVTLENMLVGLNQNIISGGANVSYNSLSTFISTPDNATLNISLPKFQLNVSDAFIFQPQLAKNEYVKSLSRKKLNGSLYASGKLSNLNIRNTKVNWGKNTYVATTASLQNIQSPKNLSFDIQKFKAVSLSTDINQFYNTDSLSIEIPKNIEINAKAKGNLNNLFADASLKTSEGSVFARGTYKNTDSIAFDATIKLEDINLKRIVKNEALDTVNLSIRASGHGTSVNTLDATLETDIKQLSYNNYDLTPLQLSGELTNGKGNVNARFKDTNLNGSINTQIELDSINPKIVADIDIIGADLRRLNLTAKNLRTQFKTKINFTGNIQTFKTKANVTDMVVVYESDPYYPGDITLDASVEKDSSAVTIKNSILNMKLQANASIDKIAASLNSYYKGLVSTDSIVSDTISKPVILHLRSQINKTPFLEDVLLAGLEKIDTTTIDIDFNEKKQSLYTNIHLPYAEYNGITIDSLELQIDAQTNAPRFTFGVRRIESGPIAIKKITFKGKTENEKMNMLFTAFDDAEKLINVASTLYRKNDSLLFNIKTDTVIFNKKLWEVPNTNQIALSEKSIQFTDFNFSNQNQKVVFGNNMTKIKKDHIGVEFQKFNLANFLNILNPDESIAKGTLNGNLIVVEPYGRTGLLAGLTIDNLEVLNAPLGNLSLKGAAIGNEKYGIDLSVKDGDLDLDMKGKYTASNEAAQLNLDFDLNKLNLSVIEHFSKGEIHKTSGFLSGKFNITGNTKEPEFNGNIGFNNTNFTIKMLDTPFKIDNEEISFNNDGINFDTFTIKDVANNTFQIKGDILTEDPLNPSFNLNVNAEKFQLLDATREDNDLFYGKANISIAAEIKGDLEIPDVNVMLSANEGTNIYYILPEEQLDIVEQDGVVVFVNRQNPDAIITRNDEENNAILNGFRFNALLALNKNAAFNVIINEKTGDNLRIVGKGDLNFSIAENGRTSLSGRYEVTEGHYKMNLYNLVSREFQIASGSTVTWSGDPMDADLDIKAIYEIKTAPSSLMSLQSSGESAAIRNSYQQRLPFFVYLNVNGDLMHPKLSFALDMPEDERGMSGGSVYSRIQQLNQQDDELNKQVFSLLVLNRFFPETGSDGSNGGTATIARDNLNQALSDQLNMFSNQLLGNSGFELSFDVDSYTDYQGSTADQRTDVDITAQKKLFNDRVIVKVGSEVNIQGENRPGQTNQMMGNVSIEYLLTEDGRFSIRGFRKNTYENIIDGQLIVNGISLIFTKQFNEFKELWKANLKEEDELTPEEKNKEPENTETKKSEDEEQPEK
ncbi:translocation/assembly module TamB domain-containing protein [Neptunitalea lumnitzerae]|uniref:Translocation and assembly module TamB C-terminal domain-containing protein n=1 Tax=Neptunitalea lumnitzerae TaxID=2965509 RepID=A0ABQ5MK24_9FLAO|nr:translocation/assembly module TamB [Neptunitalea sp. Y10]GLB49257.1 hypothetical protein Y10_16250 [Neptunitalea sp. Y10]